MPKLRDVGRQLSSCIAAVYPPPSMPAPLPSVLREADIMRFAARAAQLES